MFRCQPVYNSTAIRAIAHDSTSNTLRVIFTSGSGYDYPEVNSEDFDTLRHSESIGSSFNHNYRRRENYIRLPDSEVSSFLIRLMSRVPSDLVNV